MQLRDQATDTSTRGAASSHLHPKAFSLYFFCQLSLLTRWSQFSLDKMDESEMVLCPGPRSCIRCGPHPAAKVWVSHLRQKGAIHKHHILMIFRISNNPYAIVNIEKYDMCIDTLIIVLFTFHMFKLNVTFHHIGYYWITNWIQEKKTQSTLRWADSRRYCIYSWRISCQGILMPKYFTKRIEFQSKSSLNLTI